MTQEKTGVIVKALSGFYYVHCEDASLITCRARGKFRHDKITPLVGDQVVMDCQDAQTGTLVEVRPRRNQFRRPAVANMDQLVIIASGAVPVTDPFLIDRVAAIAESKGVEVLLCLNKWDLTPAQALYDTYRLAGFDPLPLSAVTGQGLEELRRRLVGKTSVFTGNSGVGKSSILNALEPIQAIPVGDVSQKLGRGRHTTRHVELFPLAGGGRIADTPGFSSFDEEELTLQDPAALAQSFREFRPYLDDCRFVGCAHVKEQGCAVLAALAAGKIPPTRHESYQRLYQQAKEHKPWETKHKP